MTPSPQTPASSAKPRSPLWRMLQLVLEYRGLILISIISMAGYNLFSAAPAFYTKDIIDALVNDKNIQLEKFLVVGVGIIIVFSLKGLFFFGNNYTLGLMIQHLLAKLRMMLFEHLQKLSLSFFTRSKTGDLISRFTNDLQVLQATLNVGLTGPFRDIPEVLLLIGIMAYRSWQLTLATFIIMPIALVCIQLFGKLNKRATRKRQASFSELTSLLLETISGIRIVKAFGMESYEIKRFSVANHTLNQHNLRTILISSYSTPIIEVIGAIAGAMIMAYGGYLFTQNIITAGDLGSFFISFFMLNDPVKKLNGFNLKLQEGSAAIQRIFAILDTEPEIQDVPNAIKLEQFGDKIQIDIEHFTYAGQPRPALKNIHLEVKKGEIIALVGGSGGGKTSLVNLIPRFYDVTAGSIRIDGYDLREVQLKSLCSLIAMVTQETILFNDTIASNISYGHPECPESRMIEAAKAANAHEFILNQKDGYETLIGEKGVRLSGGQRQRLTIARALIKDAPILILDEATSALDSESEIEVQQAIDRLMENRTTLVIAHRLSTVRHAHRIYVLEDGEIIEQGTHDELLAKSGRYQQLYAMQFRE